MSLITPDFGLIFWMVIIFGAVFFVLAKFGFPLITGMLDKRGAHIADSLKAAEQAQASLESLSAEQQEMIARTKAEQALILKEAAEARDKIVAQARELAEAESARILSRAKAEIASEREYAIREIRNQVALISVEVAEKIVCGNLEKTEEQLALIDRFVDEVSDAGFN